MTGVRILLLAGNVVLGVLTLALLRREEQRAVRAVLRAEAVAVLLVAGLGVVDLCGGGNLLGYLSGLVLSVTAVVLP
ncbi:hypothetical protein ACFYXM_34105 [Streptomyces sp. NPDC002476]|uniref:hypothetical protein n=1 Tax=Streptomyces sp. NPDC002476 TaxID=3364648 RepID=UPI0036C8F667